MMRQILPFRFAGTDVQGTWNLDQTKTDAARMGAASAIASSGVAPDLADLAVLMRNGGPRAEMDKRRALAYMFHDAQPDRTRNMALPLAPIAGLALRYAAVAGTAYLVTRRLERGRLSQPVEDEMDDTPEGVTARREEGQMNATARLRRVIRLGQSGPGVAVDATLLGRLKMERV